MAQFVPKAEPPHALAGGRTSFVVAQNARGYWIARERRGLIEGVFLSQREAINFALLKTAAAGLRLRRHAADDDGNST